MLGLVAALRWATDLVRRRSATAPLRKVTVHPDSLLALHIAQGKATAAAHKPLQEALLAAYNQLAGLTELAGVHVHSHVGHPWNELVDSLASLQLTAPPRHHPRQLPDPAT
eukprot:12928997-Alexandrium_andersonii.AAC.1